MNYYTIEERNGTYYIVNMRTLQSVGKFDTKEEAEYNKRILEKGN